MVARRRKRSYSRKKTFTISAIEGGAALSLASSTGLDTALQTALGGNLAGALTTIQTQTMANKTKIVGTLGAAFVGKMIAGGFGRKTLAKLGPIRIVP
jgi:hypothetical protein